MFEQFLNEEEKKVVLWKDADDYTVQVCAKQWGLDERGDKWENAITTNKLSKPDRAMLVKALEEHGLIGADTSDPKWTQAVKESINEAVTKTNKQLIQEFRDFLKKEFKIEEPGVFIVNGNKEGWDKPGHPEELVIEFEGKYLTDPDSSYKLLNGLKKFIKNYPMLKWDKNDDREDMHLQIIRKK